MRMLIPAILVLIVGFFLLFRTVKIRDWMLTRQFLLFPKLSKEMYSAPENIWVMRIIGVGAIIMGIYILWAFL